MRPLGDNERKCDVFIAHVSVGLLVIGIAKLLHGEDMFFTVPKCLVFVLYCSEMCFFSVLYSCPVHIMCNIFFFFFFFYYV